MLIANATGCSSIYGGSAPQSLLREREGPRPGVGQLPLRGQRGVRLRHDARLGAHDADRLARLVDEALESGASAALKEAMSAWLDGKDDATTSRETGDALGRPPREGSEGEARSCRRSSACRDLFTKKSVWVDRRRRLGLRHRLRRARPRRRDGRGLNVLVLDTEVYSNTGGQSSKATPTGSVAKFAERARRRRRRTSA